MYLRMQILFFLIYRSILGKTALVHMLAGQYLCQPHRIAVADLAFQNIHAFIKRLFITGFMQRYIPGPIDNIAVKCESPSASFFDT